MSNSHTSAPTPLVSIVVPVFNAEPFLSQALRSLREQTYPDLEIICLNDGSTDGSLAVMENHAAEDARVQIIDKANEGYGATCNRGIDAAHGEWIGILEPDDWLLPQAVERMVACAAEASAAGCTPDIVKTPYWRVLFADTPDQALVHCYYKGTAAPTGAKRLTNGWAVQGNPAGACCTALMEYHPSIWSALYRTDFLREHGIRFLPIPGAGWADNPFLVETMAAARSIAYLDEPFYCYREETPAHFAATIRNQPALVFDRWNDGADVLERYPNLDARVVQAHYHRGFNNRDKPAAVLGAESEMIATETARMFTRMDANLVLGDAALSPAQKTLFASVRGLSYQPSPSETLASKARSLRQRLHNLRTVGPTGARTIARLH